MVTSMSSPFLSFLQEKLEVDLFTLGTTLPHLKDVTIRSLGSLTTNFVSLLCFFVWLFVVVWLSSVLFVQFVVFDASYNGEAALGVHLESFGKAVRVQADLSKFSGKVCFACLKIASPSF